MASRVYSGTVVVPINEFWKWLKDLNVAPNSEDNVEFKPPRFNMQEETIEVDFQASTKDVQIIGDSKNAENNDPSNSDE